jgi:hypothetical protein
MSTPSGPSPHRRLRRIVDGFGGSVVAIVCLFSMPFPPSDRAGAIIFISFSFSFPLFHFLFPYDDEPSE